MASLYMNQIQPNIRCALCSSILESTTPPPTPPQYSVYDRLTQVKEHFHQTQSPRPVEIAKYFANVAPFFRKSRNLHSRQFALRNHESTHVPRTIRDHGRSKMERLLNPSTRNTRIPRGFISITHHPSSTCTS